MQVNFLENKMLCLKSMLALTKISLCDKYMTDRLMSGEPRNPY